MRKTEGMVLKNLGVSAFVRDVPVVYVSHMGDKETGPGHGDRSSTVESSNDVIYVDLSKAFLLFFA